MPPAGSTLRDLMQCISDRIVNVLQLNEEREVLVPLRDWADYLEARRAKPEAFDVGSQCVSFDIRRTALGKLVSLPQSFLRDAVPEKSEDKSQAEAGWYQTATSEAELLSSTLKDDPVNENLMRGVGYHGGALYSNVAKKLEQETFGVFSSIIGRFDEPENEPILFCSTWTAGSHSDFSIAFAGAASFYYVVRGEVWLYLVDPSKNNLAKFEEWSKNSIQSNESDSFFGNVPGKWNEIALKAGQSIEIPPGWIVGVFFPTDTILIGSNVLQKSFLDVHVLCYAMELRAKTPRKFHHPHLEELFGDLILWINSNSQVLLDGSEQSLIFQRFVSQIRNLAKEQMKKRGAGENSDEDWKGIPVRALQALRELEALNVTIVSEDANVLAEAWVQSTQVLRSFDQASSPSKDETESRRTLVGSIFDSEEMKKGEQRKCDKCKEFFSLKGFGPHKRHCRGNSKGGNERINIGPNGCGDVQVKLKAHKSSCHRCGNVRKQIVLCPSCPNTFCKRCSERLREEHGDNVFIDGCPFCKKLCCCGAEKGSTCIRKNHCYKRCPTSLVSGAMKKRTVG